MHNPLMKHRAPVLILIGVISVVSILNWIHDYGAWMITPVKVVHGWEIALGGNLSSNVLATLATTLTAGFLHADGSHLGGNMLFLWLFGVVVCELCSWRWMLTAFLLTTVG
nr:rhomboid family intramembrane serine protease [bacterium]